VPGAAGDDPFLTLVAVGVVLFECIDGIDAHQMTEALVDRSSLLPHTYSVGERKSADRLVEKGAPDLRLRRGASLIVISLLSLGSGQGSGRP
jgi:hypothetical protein